MTVGLSVVVGGKHERGRGNGDTLEPSRLMTQSHRAAAKPLRAV